MFAGFVDCLNEAVIASGIGRRCQEEFGGSRLLFLGILHGSRSDCGGAGSMASGISHSTNVIFGSQKWPFSPTLILMKIRTARTATIFARKFYTLKYAAT